jgi:hypothetical protein
VAEHDWKITKPGQACCSCKSQFPVGQAYFSALFQEPDSFSRQDYCADCFTNKRPENVFYYWKAMQPDPDAEARPQKRQRPVVDAEYVLEFFKRLEEAPPATGVDEGGPAATAAASQRLAFRYILALMLTRRKVLVFDGRKRGADGNDVHLFRERRGGQTHQVQEPQLAPEEVAAVSAELGVLLGLTPAAPSGGNTATAANGTGSTDQAAPGPQEAQAVVENAAGSTQGATE